MIASELRIGNIVLFNDDGKEYTVVEINKNGISIVDVSDETWIEIDMFSGIPLTESWLIKFGFYQYGNQNLWKQRVKRAEHKSSITINTFCHTSTTNHQYISLNTFPFKKIYFVHQLQNLYHALTGTELEIKN
mgnify:CR=1 FL=1